MLAAAGLVLAALAAYSNSFSVPFILDDAQWIIENPRIWHLWPIWSAFSPLPPPQVAPHHFTVVGGRPVLSLSLAINYALGGTATESYHVLNLAIHIFAGLALFGIVRRTLLMPKMSGLFDAAALPLAFGIALMWTLHPLQTEAVTYVIQRAESMMGLFYLLTLYCFIRGVEVLEVGGSSLTGRTDLIPDGAAGHERWPKSATGWLLMSIICCLLGMATKEVIVSAPMMVLLYDRTFVAGSFRAAWKKRWATYCGLAGTWLLLGGLMLASSSRGIGLGATWWSYLFTECRAVVIYLRLAIWPHPLILDYGTETVKRWPEVVPSMLILFPLIAGTVVALWRWPRIGFVGAWFFVILGPETLIPVAGQPMAEHRLYLPLAAVVTLLALGIFTWIGRWSTAGILLLAAGLGWLTYQRNETYRSELSIWSDTVAKRPGNARAHDSLANALNKANRVQEALVQYQEAVQLDPHFAAAHYNWAECLEKLGRMPEAITHYEQALKIDPADADAYYNLAGLFARLDRVAEAELRYEQVLQINPGLVDAHINLGNLFLQAGDLANALGHFEAAVRINPRDADSHYDLGNALVALNRLPEAVAQYEQAVQIEPGYADAQCNLGNALAALGRFPEAMAHFNEELKINPDDAQTHSNLGVILAGSGRITEAIEHFKQAIRINPADVGARNYLARLQSIQSSVGPGK